MVVSMESKSQSSSSHDVRKATEYPIRTKIVACIGLTCVQILAAVILKSAQHNGVYNFSPQSSLVLSEALKVLISIGYLLHKSGSIQHAQQTLLDESSAPLLLHMFCLASIYSINNGITFWLYARADPGSIAVMKSGSTIISAMLLYLVRGFRLSLARWTTMVVQMLGLIVAQYDGCTGRSHLHARVYGALWMSVLNSSAANVWNEHVVKRFHGAGLATKNVHLYLFGTLLNAAAFCGMRATHGVAPPFLHGYDAGAVGVVLCNALLGVAINVVYKYADAVVKNIATGAATVALVVLSAWMFGGRADGLVFVGAGIVVCGTVLYFMIGAGEEKLRGQRCNGGWNCLKLTTS